jgi:hypothetical protein
MNRLSVEQGILEKAALAMPRSETRRIGGGRDSMLLLLVVLA